jgi:hypothetical protein
MATVPARARGERGMVGSMAQRSSVEDRVWPLSFSPAQTIREDSASSRKPKAEPCSQLKRVMNWL